MCWDLYVLPGGIWPYKEGVVALVLNTSLENKADVTSLASYLHKYQVFSKGYQETYRD